MLKCSRPEMQKLQNWQIPFASLKAHLQVKTQTDDGYATFLRELEAMVGQQEAFSAKILQFICECEMLDKVQAICFLFVLSVTQHPKQEICPGLAEQVNSPGRVG